MDYRTHQSRYDQVSACVSQTLVRVSWLADEDYFDLQKCRACSDCHWMNRRSLYVYRTVRFLC